jgi:hypothetical protein
MKTVHRACTAEVLDKLTANGQPYDVLIGIADVETGDVILYEDPEGRQIARYVASVTFGHDFQLNIIEGSEQDFTLVALSAAPATVLEALFAAGSILIGIGLEIHDKQVYLIHDPQYLPVLACEPIEPQIILETLKISDWPDGCFSILFMAKATDVSTGRPVINIVEHTVMAMTKIEGADVFVEVDDRFLRTGKIRDKFGRMLEPYFGAGPDVGQKDEELDQATLDEVNDIVGGIE